MMLHRQRQMLLQDLTHVTDFVVIGSAALGIYAPQVVSRQPVDVDLLVPNDLAQLNAIGEALVLRGFSLWSWHQQVHVPMTADQLAGRFYLRARRGEECLDLTYACPWVPFSSAWQKRVLWRGIPLASLTHITRLMAVRHAAKDCERLQKLGLTWPVSTCHRRGSGQADRVGQAVAPQIAA